MTQLVEFPLDDGGETTAEFGLTATAETRVVTAKGSAEIHLTVTPTWAGQKDTGATA